MSAGIERGRGVIYNLATEHDLKKLANYWQFQSREHQFLLFLLNEHVIFIYIQTILPNIVNIELREFFYFSRQNPNPHSVISVSNRSRKRLRMSDKNGGH